MDDFFELVFAQSFLDDFPAFDVKFSLNEDGQVGAKAVVEKIRKIAPVYAKLDDWIQSQEFLQALSMLTGIPNLLYDPHYFGGGTHENRQGQDLDVHVDFNRHPETNSHRRLNLIVYLNPEWKADWGGCLELHSNPRDVNNKIKTIEPLFNRAVLFETTEWSWHGFTRIQLPLEKNTLSRKSIALYFYTKDRPSVELAETHSTIYVDRPLPAHFQAGHSLTEHDVSELRVLLTRRDHHIQRLYREWQQTQHQLERIQAHLGLSRGSRLFNVLRMLNQFRRKLFK